MEKTISRIRASLLERDLKTTLKHFEEVKILLAQESWEAANGQIRTFLESFYNDLCFILLNKPKKGGEARKVLQDNNVISTEQANYIMSFMKLSHGSGSHPGVSSEPESLYRWFGCLSLAVLGCSLFPNIILVSDVFKLAGIDIPDEQEFHDTLFKTWCPICETPQTLDQCSVIEIEKETHYKCVNSCQTILIIGFPGEKAFKGRGIRLNNYVIRNLSDVTVYIPNAIPLLIPKSPAALRNI